MFVGQARLGRRRVLGQPAGALAVAVDLGQALAGPLPGLGDPGVLALEYPAVGHQALQGRRRGR